MVLTATRSRLTALAAGGTVVVVAVFLSLVLRGRSADVMFGLYFFHNGPPALILWWLGRLVLLRQPGNRLGVLLLWIAGLATAHVIVAATADLAIVGHGYSAAITDDHPLIPGELPLQASVPLFVMNWLWVPQVVLMVSVLPLVFPDGRLPGPRWRIGLWFSGAACVTLVTATAIDAWPTADWGTDRVPPTVVVLFLLGGVLVLTATSVAFTGLGVRWHRAPPAERPAFRAVGSTVGLLALVGIATYPWQRVWIPSVLVLMYVALAAYALAAARYRLHDIEPVLGKTVVAAAVSLCVAAVYLVVMVGLGSLVDRQVEDEVLPVLAVATVALLILPLHRWVRRSMHRLVYGRVADRTEVMSTLAERTTSTTRPDTMVEEAVQLLLRSSGASRVEARLADGGAVCAGSAQGRMVSRSTEIRYGSERLGELVLYVHAAADLSPDAQHILVDVAHLLAVALHNDRLAAELRDRLEDLAASRRRIVAAQDAARRSLERDLHDGAQAQLIGLRLQVGALQAAGTPLDGVASAVDDAIRTLRETIRGVHPAMLDQDGPGAALVTRVRDLGVPVDVQADLLRYDLTIELAVYYATLEAMQNAVRHGHPTRIGVRLTSGPSGVRFEVADDGTGFDPAVERPGAGLRSIEDRVQALGGDVTVTSAAGAGTTVTGWIPAQPLVSDK